MKTASNFFTGVLIGGVVGGILGLLLAPGKGSETREAIRQNFESVSGQFKQAVEQRKRELENEIQKAMTL